MGSGRLFVTTQVRFEKLDMRFETMRKLIILFILLTGFGCSPNHNNSNNFPVKPLIILNAKDDGWGADIKMSITNISENDTSYAYKAISHYDNSNVGFIVIVPKSQTDSKGFGKLIILKSIGTESDNLLHTLTALYKQKANPASTFVESASPSYVDLNEFAKSIGGNTKESDVKEYKLFFQTKDDEAELYLNIDPIEKWVEVSEKDPEYRPVVIKALTK